jgi:excisionase family DNA binding protein
MRLRPPELVRLSVKVAAAYLEVTVRTFRRWQAAGKMPPRVKVGREQRYRFLDVHQLKNSLLSGDSRPVGEQN